MPNFIYQPLMIILIVIIISGLIVNATTEIRKKRDSTIPHRCEHCDNKFYITPDSQSMINDGGTVECPICHQWTH